MTAEHPEPSRVYAAPGGKTHLALQIFRRPVVYCRADYPQASWTPMPAGTPVTCETCRRNSVARDINRRAAGRGEA